MKNTITLLLLLFFCIFAARGGSLTPGEKEELKNWLALPEDAYISSKHKNIDWLAGPYPDLKNGWENNSIGLSDKVPPPFLPITLRSNIASLWNRNYHYLGRMYPSQIESGGGEIFSREPVFTLKVGGREIDFSLDGSKILKATKTEYVLEKALSLSGGKVTVRSSLDYAGVIIFEISFAPSGGLALEKFTLDFYFKKNFAEALSLPTFYNYLTHEHDHDKYLESIKPISGEIRLPYSYHIWIGNKKTGFDFACETSAFWSAPEKEGAYLVTESDKEVRFSANMATTSKTISRPFTWRFSLLATPSKPLPKDIRSMVYFLSVVSYRVQEGLDMDLHKSIGVQWALVGSSGIKGFQFSEPDEERRTEYNRSVANFERMGMRRAVYNDLRALNIFAAYGAKHFWPVWASDLESHKKFLSSLLSGASPPAREAREMDINYFSKSLADYMLFRYLRSYERNRQGAYYFDLSPPVNHGPNRALGIPLPGEEDKLYYDLFGKYRFLKRLYSALKEQDPEFFIWLNAHKIPPMMGAFADAQLCGEALSRGFFKGAVNRRKAREGTLTDADYLPDYTSVPDLIYDYGFLQTLGFRIVLLPQILKWNEAWADANKERVEELTFKLLSKTMVRDIPLALVRLHVKTAVSAISALDRLGRFDGSEKFIPGDELVPGLCSNPEVRSALYVKAGALLLIVANDGGGEKQTEIDLDRLAAYLPGKGRLQAVETFTGSELAPSGKALRLAVSGGKVSVVRLTRRP